MLSTKHTIDTMQITHPLKSTIYAKGSDTEYLVCGYVDEDGSWIIETQDHYAIHSTTVQMLLNKNQIGLIVWSIDDLYQAMPYANFDSDR